MNGEPLATVSLPPAEWKSFLLDLSESPFDQAFVMEIWLEREPRPATDWRTRNEAPNAGRSRNPAECAASG
jgi:hypothetical protein